MASANLPASEIASFYKNKGIFVTGATGFLGKVLLEKLLRSCSDLKMIYVLVRPKKGVPASERLAEIFNCKVSLLEPHSEDIYFIDKGIDVLFLHFSYSRI